VTPIPQVVQVQGYAVAEHDFATVWDADVLIWVMSQIFAAQDPGFPTSHVFRCTACQLLIAVARATDNAEYQLLNGALTPPRTTGIRTTFRHGEHWRSRQVSRTDQRGQLITRSDRGEAMEFVLPKSFYLCVLNRCPVLALNADYFAHSLNVERWFYRLAREHAGRQPDHWRFELQRLQRKNATLDRFSDFTLDIRRNAACQPLVGQAPTVERRGGALTLFGQIDPPVLLISNGIPFCYRDSGWLLLGRQAHRYRDFGHTNWRPSLSRSNKSGAPEGFESESHLPFFEGDGRLGGRGTGVVAPRGRRAAVMVGALKHQFQCVDEPVRKLAHGAAKHCAEAGGRSARPMIGTPPEFCGSTDFLVRGRAPSAAKTKHRLPTNVLASAAGLPA
jgi:hypothetical protein